MKNICLLGATGSIGTQVLDLIKEFNNEYKLVCFSFGSNIDKARKIIDEFNPLLVSCIDKVTKELLELEYPNITFSYGEKGLLDVTLYDCCNPMVINSLVGSIGFMPSYECLKAKRNLYLANKESLVIGGELLIPLAIKSNVRIIPIDSEHSAILQILQGKNILEVKRLLITASGGSFRNKTYDELNNVTKEEALNHPNWKMGNKITIDCATMMNKGFELIEAHYLYNIDMEKITPIIHEESIIHSMVEFNDGSIFAQMASSDMHLPIKYAICENHTASNNIEPLDLLKVSTLHFREVDYNRYPMVKLAIDAIKIGGIYPTILNAANDIAVNLFLNDKIKFLDIEKIVKEALQNNDFIKFNNETLSYELILKVDSYVKESLLNRYTLGV